MTLTVYILGTLSFAVLGALLYVWGYRRSRRMPQLLQRRMRQLMEDKILALLAECPQGATLKKLADEIRPVKVGSLLQGYRFSVANPLVTAEAVVGHLIASGAVREAMKGRSRRYFLLAQEREAAEA